MTVNTAIVLAGGSGSRMKSNVPKQYISINDRPIIYYSLLAFEKSEFISNIILVTRAEDVEYCRKEIVAKYNLTKVSHVVSGGAERYLSVYNGLMNAADSNYVWIHDGARPCIDEEMLIRLRDAAVLYNAVVAAVPSKDTVKIADDNQFVKNTPDRNFVWNVQTPQIFRTEELIQAYAALMELDEHPGITDDAMIMEQFGDIPVRLEMGDYNNIKVTTPEDIELVKNYFKKFKKYC